MVARCLTEPVINDTRTRSKRTSKHSMMLVSLNDVQCNNISKFTIMEAGVSFLTGTSKARVLLVADGARGDQCDACGATYESSELKNPVSKMNPELKVEIRDTDHLFYRLDLFQDALQKHAEQHQSVWKPNVRAMTKQWLDMGLRPRQ